MGGASFGIVMLLVTAAPEAREVSLDWSQVPDAVIARCGLDDFATTTFLGLIDEGYAIVRVASPSGVRLQVRFDAERFVVHGIRFEDERTEEVPAPTPCDATIQVELVDRMRRIVGALFSAPKATTPPPVAPVGTATVTRQARSWRVFGGGGIVVPSTTPLIALRGGVRRRVGNVFFGLALELGFRGTDAVTVFEPVIAAQTVFEIVRTGGFALLGGAEAGALAHLFIRDDGNGGHLDGRFGVLIEGRLPVLGATLTVMPYVRTRAVRQRIGTQTPFRANNLGVLLTVSVSYDL